MKNSSKLQNKEGLCKSNSKLRTYKILISLTLTFESLRNLKLCKVQKETHSSVNSSFLSQSVDLHHSFLLSMCFYINSTN